MNLPDPSGLIKIGKSIIQSRSPQLLLGASIGATIGAVILSAKGGYEARGIVDKAEAEKGQPLEVKEKIQLTWLCYMPAALTTVTALGAQSGLHVVHVKEKKALAATYLAAAEQAKHELKKATLTDEQMEKLAEKNKQGKVLTFNQDGEVEEMYLIRDAKTGRDIWSNKNRIEDALNELNNVLNGSGDVELNTFYTYAGFPTIPDGDEEGWSGALLNLRWSTDQRSDGRPVKVFTFQPGPSKGYDR